MDVVVIGGGIIGTSTALELADSGMRVALCEKGGIGHEQSSRNWGWVRISRRDPREVPLMAEALRIWADLNRRTGRERASSAPASSSPARMRRRSTSTSAGTAISRDTRSKAAC